ncbi:MAG: hypothetical protein KDK40_02275, partial [Chlamydiia bacterium]|nr:hypothetical protein [Chlamydiia bacterium]
HLEVKNQPFEILGLVKKSWQIVVGATYFSIPFILGYLLLWMLLGLFLLLASIPYFGMVFAVVLSFVPYLIQLAALVIVGVSLGMLFFFTPLMALTGIQRIEILQLLGRRFRIDPFLNICLFLLGLLPFIVTSILLSGAYYLTLPLLELGFDSTFHSLQMGVMLFPCALLLTPSVVFFFNFGAESHALMHRLMRATEMEG